MVKLSEEVKEFCKVQYKINCGACKIHALCTQVVPITEHHLNQRTEAINNAIKNKQHVTK